MCTRVLWNTDSRYVMAGRTMDWPESTQPTIVAFPRGRERDGGKVGDLVVVAENPLRWTSRYASLATTVYGIGTVDGFNEAGLGMHALYLKSTDVGARDPGRPGIHMGLFGQYLLDQAGTVAEALALLDTFQPVMVESHGRKATLHFALEDASGDSAIIEFEGGEPVIHHGRQFTIMTNDPTYDEQLELMSQQDFSHPSRDMPLPGNVNPVDRFQRASYYAALLPEPTDTRQAVASLMAIMRNVSVPFGAPYGEFGVYNTEYRTVVDLTQKLYFFELSTSPSVIWIDFGGLKLTDEPLEINPYDTTLVGDATSRFEPQKVAF
ncbi:choloylglycine hydrolase [Mycolicibacterium moriokaense]|uniref:Choloylglycine hydrolase n=1 Tax=Mycolicibacterium moriokaense TaxID=39691 RepID=A0AAD1M5X3_9MYCO|nr:linear amide C-N hydrolase [Mycolicibacterium moriokaense]MCV7041102.1 linear amide C-N hydrolase [Mycolicibacterium moriokaense]ORB27284.1 choloylglycine hydrolase [Mycolicibacterium moriokaense]BBX00664.1 choloylglycine hydrolase [Mycolicibacterium moriokaense]